MAERIENAPGEASLAAALKPFGWTCGPEFWQRYYTDAWVFNLANAVERLARQRLVMALGGDLPIRDPEQVPNGGSDG